MFPAPYRTIPTPPPPEGGVFTYDLIFSPGSAIMLIYSPFRGLGGYNTPLVLGKTILFTSLFTAIFMAFAKALNIASILWCSFWPSAFMLRLHFAASLKDLKKW